MVENWLAGGESQAENQAATQPRSQTRSNSVQLYQTRKGQGLAGVRTNSKRPALRAARPSRNNQSRSNQIKPNQTCERVERGCEVDRGQWLVASGWWRKRPAESGPVKPSQTQSNRFDSASSKNKTILSEMLMLVAGPKLHSVGLIKPNQTKSNLRGGKKCKFQGFTVQNSMFKTPQYAEKAKQV